MTEPSPAVVLVDDLRVFRAAAVPVAVARTSAAAVAYLAERHTARHHLAQLWLDHDLGEVGGVVDTAMPVVDWLCARAHEGVPVNVDVVVVHTSNVVGGSAMVRALARGGYNTVRVSASEHFTIEETLVDAAPTSQIEVVMPHGGGAA